MREKYQLGSEKSSAHLARADDEDLHRCHGFTGPQGYAITAMAYPATHPARQLLGEVVATLRTSMFKPLVIYVLNETWRLLRLTLMLARKGAF